MKPLILAALATLAATGPATAAPPAPFTGKVVAVSDGDTLSVLAPGNQQTRVRLHGIDAPEKGQPFGSRARQHLGDLVVGQVVTVTPVGDLDRYGRTVARVTLRDRDVALDLIAAGLAWHWTRYDSSAAYARAEAQAQRDGAGLWSDPRPVPPWEWRRLPKEQRDARRSPAPADR